MLHPHLNKLTSSLAEKIEQSPFGLCLRFTKFSLSGLNRWVVVHRLCEGFVMQSQRLCEGVILSEARWGNKLKHISVSRMEEGQIDLFLFSQSAHNAPAQPNRHDRSLTAELSVQRGGVHDQISVHEVHPDSCYHSCHHCYHTGSPRTTYLVVYIQWSVIFHPNWGGLG